ncbi:ABC transporter permease subunit [Coraliomargarita sp. SDUM461003]|uniref:ABC transporter permease subunit n=1 Tax=Thalassobacterium maritimum TaxID=3041265 RepID=A0ABU1ASW0_9BACT|nr:ABC transporter permease subunit [Coraliomargarita sp. SDUM461003]MDQ8207252.1 ABC transporter permease subunit [Coraliomargarita sp. SDUM461003]
MSLLNSFTRIRLIAGTTFLEAVRQKFFNSLLIISIALVASSTFFQQFDFGTGELKFITDFGFGALFFFGSILSITATTQLFFNEIENRTALTMLAKPVYKLEFLAGKFLGAHLLMLSFSLVITLVLSGILYWREAALLARLGEDVLLDGPLVRYGDVFVFGFLQWIKFGILAAITLFVASFSNTNLYTIIVSFFVLIICQLQYIARDAYSGMEAGLERFLVMGLGLIFPNFQLFNIGDQLVFDVEQALPLTTVLRLAAYGLIYTCAFILLAQVNFRRREI